MGSLISRPKIPVVSSTPEYIVVSSPDPEPVVSSVPAASSVSSAASSTADSGSVDETAPATETERRTENLLRRGRGRFGTVLTGFQGILSSASSTSSSKRLLGE